MTKQLKIGLGALCLLIVLLILSNFKQRKNISSYENIFNHDVSHVSKIIIQSGDEAIELAKLDTTWKISGNDTLIVKDRSISNFIDEVLTVKRGTIVTKNPEKYFKFSISDSLGTHVALINQSDKTIGFFIYGKSKTDYGRGYIRTKDDYNVYITDKNISYMLSTSPTYWGEVPSQDIPIAPSP
tara:strand:+ start:733 stop:1284 length:552 start_codon:yes stop_codon:yes gene_type:complete